MYSFIELSTWLDSALEEDSLWLDIIERRKVAGIGGIVVVYSLKLLIQGI